MVSSIPSFLTTNLKRARAAILALAEARKNAAHRLGDGKELFFGKELVEDLGRLRHRAESSADHELESSLRFAAHETRASDRSEVVEIGQSARVLFAARERHLELPAEVLGVVVAEEEEREGVGVRRHVEPLVLAYAGVGASGDVANRIAARFARGDADGSEPPVHVRRVFDVHEVKLDVLPGRDVEDPIGVFLGDFRQDVELVGRYASVGNLDPLHPGCVPERARALGRVSRRKGERLRLVAVVALPVVVTLAVRSAPQARLCKELLFDLALFSQLDLGFEDVDLAAPSCRQALPEDFLPRFACAHRIS